MTEPVVAGACLDVFGVSPPTLGATPAGLASTVGESQQRLGPCNGGQERRSGTPQ